VRLFRPGSRPLAAPILVQEVVLIRLRLATVVAAAVLCATLVARESRAAAEIHKFNIVFAAIPSQIVGGSFNDDLDFINRTSLNPVGLESLDKINFGWLFEAEARAFVRPNFAITAGVGQMKAISRREFLPAIGLSVIWDAEVLTVPLHVGGMYYMQAYNQGDFQARAYFGGGVLGLVDNKATFDVTATVPDSVTGGTRSVEFKRMLTQDAPGWYAESGVHMFFATRYSVIIGAVYRSAQVRNMIDAQGGFVAPAANGKPFRLDMSGVGAKLAMSIGL
jgi:hypothetical protein